MGGAHVAAQPLGWVCSCKPMTICISVKSDLDAVVSRGQILLNQLSLDPRPRRVWVQTIPACIRSPCNYLWDVRYKYIAIVNIPDPSSG